MRTLIDREHSIEITYTHFYQAIVDLFRDKFNDENFPTSKKEYDLLVEKKKAYLREDLDINLTHKKQNVARNIVAKMCWDIKGGYQQIQGNWNNIIDRFILELKNSKKLPLEVLLVRDVSDDYFYKQKEESNMDFSITKHYFHNDSYLLLNEDSINEEECHFEEISSEYEATLNTAFMASEIAVDTGGASCGSTLGTGDFYEDAKYLKNTFGISYCGNDSLGHYAFDHSGNLIFAVKMIRLPDERIDGMILMLEGLKKDF